MPKKKWQDSRGFLGLFISIPFCCLYRVLIDYYIYESYI